MVTLPDDVIILPDDVERLTRLVAVQIGKTPEEVLKEAVENHARLAGISKSTARMTQGDIDMDRVRQIIHRIASKPLLDPRSAEEILDEAWGKLR